MSEHKEIELKSNSSPTKEKWQVLKCKDANIVVLKGLIKQIIQNC